MCFLFAYYDVMFPGAILGTFIFSKQYRLNFLGSTCRDQYMRKYIENRNLCDWLHTMMPIAQVSICSGSLCV